MNRPTLLVYILVKIVQDLCVEHVLDKRDTFVFEYLICVFLMYIFVFDVHYNCGSFEKSLIEMVLWVKMSVTTKVGHLLRLIKLF